jgi:hypothetical protein
MDSLLNKGVMGCLHVIARKRVTAAKPLSGDAVSVMSREYLGADTLSPIQNARRYTAATKRLRADTLGG